MVYTKGKAMTNKQQDGTKIVLIQEILSFFLSIYRYTCQQWTAFREGLPPAQIQAVIELSISPGLNMTQLAGRMLVSKQQLTKIIGALVEKGFVIRAENDENRRVVLLYLTDHGQDFAREIFRSFSEKFSFFLAEANGLQMEEILYWLRCFHKALEKDLSQNSCL